GGAKKGEGSSSSLNGMSSILAKVWEPGVDGLEEGTDIKEMDKRKDKTGHEKEKSVKGQDQRRELLKWKSEPSP
ncbi:hypothetical protein Tco_0919393, partial [Tanacetum coccineum]